MIKTNNKTMSIVSFLLCAILIIGCIKPIVIFSDSQYSEVDETLDTNISKDIEQILNKSLDWIIETQNYDGSFGKSNIINESFYSIESLRNNGYDVTDEISVINNKNYINNCDVLSHKIKLCKEDIKTINELLDMQNSDGGFGINNKFKSDVYDTLLALEAFINLNKEEYNNDIEEMINCILKMQNPDGGWSYNDVNDSDKALTIRVVYNILLYINTNQIPEENIEPILKEAEVFLEDTKNISINEENMELKIYFELIKIINEDYTCIEKFISELSDLQNSNGSFCDNYYYTYLVIKYLNSIGDIDKLYKITSMNLNLNKIYFEVNTLNEIIGDYEILYDTVTDKEFKIITRIYNDKNIVYSQENKLILNKEENVVNGTAFSYKINEMKEKTFLVEVYLYDDNEILISTSDYFKVCDSSENQFILEADENVGEDYSISLSWNDLSGENEKYGYRILRSEDGGKKWETRSSWDGNEKVKVLNIYPSSASENYVKDWMNMVVDEETGEVAGKGLIEVETVLIDDYVNNSDYYMKDENGDYKYDVLFFGATDSNNYKDLNYKSQQSVQKFIDSGRGVLFGHDTVYFAHKCFESFADKIGFKTYCAYSNLTTSVSVVKEGFLTGFPWLIRGNLTVPEVHNSGQFAGGTLNGTVWMILNTSNATTDYSTGARNDVYLVTNNQLGFIQTGHSAGQATADECKVLANTLFYLKQYTVNTSAKDNSFYDITKPLKPEVKLSLSECDKDKYSIKTTLSSKDLGTAYKYKVQALPKSDRTVPVNSNIIEAEAFSGLKGYVVIKTNSEVSATDKIRYDEEGKIIVDIVGDEDNTVEYEIENIDKIKKNYLHIFAIDNADNISEEYIYNLENSYEEFGATKVTTAISSDKTFYNLGEITQLIVSTKSDFHNINATGVVEIYDSKNILVDTVESGVNMEINSDNLTNIECEWNVENIVTGQYEASVKWYYGNNLISEDRTEFNVIPNGKITDVICSDKKIYTMEDTIKLTDNVYNDTVNIFEDNLELIIDIYEEGKEENSVKNITTQISTIAGGTNSYTDYVEASELGEGDYKAVTQLKNKTEIITSSNTSFSVTDLISVNDNFKGSINVNKNSDKEQLFKCFVTNTGNSNVYKSTVRISVYKADGEKISEIDKQVDISVGETIELSEMFNTEALKIDTYPVVLSLITEEGEEIILANSGFEINKINSYTVTFVNFDGTVIDTQSVEYGSSAITPIIDDNIINGNYKYEFTGWDTDFSYVTKDLTIKAVYKKTEISGNSEKEPEATIDNKITKNNESVDTGDKFNIKLLILLVVSSLTVILIRLNKKTY